MGPDAQTGSAAARNGIPMLSDNNYTDWSASIQAYFFFIGFLDYVYSDMSPPAEDRGDLHLKYFEQKQKAVGVIFQSLNKNNHAKLLNRNNEKDPIALYNVIINYYQSNQSTNQARVFFGIRVGNPTTSSVVDISDKLLAKIINESAFFNKRGPFCKNEVHNPLTKSLAEDCCQSKKKKGKKNSLEKLEKVKHTETTPFKDSDSSPNKSHVVKFSKAFKASSNSLDTSFYLDSAASCHMVGSLDSFCNFKEGSFRVETVNGSYTSALGSGDVSFVYQGKIITLKCIYVPNIKENLISMGKLWKHGFLIKKLPNDRFSIRKEDFTLMDGYVKDNMFHLNLSLTKVYQLHVSKLSECTLHNGAGHPNNVVLRHMFPQVKNPPFAKPALLENLTNCHTKEN
ncbi:hypothetical protein O181_081968 [Austropuccinia psidii MF-1]|uniref:Retrovirus-related Pol polyprotein from transposon TNT 1-94-like beta-barrel domain-containing protein n=1 Tax=Austropuccinia psidii MF-1 TaxID=1389203 RepID=A0A9Q3FLL0_9BASI|nr:hypothetical protein [Austropuccinia psidii MF-1]